MSTVTSTLAAAAVLFTVLSAHAQSDDRQAAQRAYEEAKAAYEQGDHERSLEKLREAYGHLPNPALKISIARRLLDLDRPEEALRELEGLEVRDRRLRKQLDEEIARVEDILAQPVPVVIETEPPGAAVRLGEQPPATSPVRVSMPRGLVVITVEKEGFEPITDNMHIRGTKPLKRRYEMTPRSSTLRVELAGQAEGLDVEPIVTLNGDVVAAGPELTVSPGKVTVSCGYPGSANPTVLQVVVPSGKATMVRCALPEPPSRPGTWKEPVGWASVGGGAAAVAAGIGILVSYAVDQSSYPEPQYTIRDSSKPLAGGLVTGLGAGLVGMGLGFLLTR